MASVFVGELKLVPYNFAPANYADCNGQLLPIDQFTELFQVIGTIYGGDGEVTFAVPDLRGRAAIHMGVGPGGVYVIGQSGGAQSVTLSIAQMPVHSHNPALAGVGGNSVASPVGARMASGGPALYAPTTGAGALMPLSSAGSNLPHDNMAPYLVLRWVIALFGTFPSSN